MPDKTVLQEFNNAIWQKFVESVSNEFDQRAALSAYEGYYKEIPPSTDEECFYYGILLFELGFSSDPLNVEYLLRAKKIFEIYLKYFGDEDWDVISDRLEDIQGALGDRKDLLPELPKDWLAGLAAEMEDDAAGPRDMVLIEAGPFLFGPDKREVAIPSYYIDRHPITNSQFLDFVETANYRPARYAGDPLFNAPDQPVVGISYMDAQKYAEWAGKRLPTEEQWEKASRGTDGRTYPWGEEPPNPSIANYATDGERNSHLGRVGGYPGCESVYEVADMVGMVWEWTCTPHEKYTDHNVIKGASWVDPPTYLSCTARLHAHPKEKQDILGFRCVAEA